MRFAPKSRNGASGIVIQRASIADFDAKIAKCVNPVIVKVFSLRP
jgi:hypothetical protein